MGIDALPLRGSFSILSGTRKAKKQNFYLHYAWTKTQPSDIAAQLWRPTFLADDMSKPHTYAKY